MEKIIKAKPYKEAFKCDKCHAGMDCPCYISILMQDTETQALRVEEGCCFVFFFDAIIRMTASTEIHTKTIQSRGNDVIMQLYGVAREWQRATEHLKDLKGLPKLEDKDSG